MQVVMQMTCCAIQQPLIVGALSSAVSKTTIISTLYCTRSHNTCRPSGLYNLMFGHRFRLIARFAVLMAMVDVVLKR